MNETAFKSLGSKNNEYQGLETFKRPQYSAKIILRSDEVTAICPITSQPDWYTVEVTYSPYKLCIESKSFKLFMHSLRETGMFCEALADHVLKTVLDTAKPHAVRVVVTQKSRGGVVIVATSQIGEV